MTDFANPTKADILRAVPLLQWRKCNTCDYVGLYSDNIIPMCCCHMCQSSDTRNMVEANKILHDRGETT